MSEAASSTKRPEKQPKRSGSTTLSCSRCRRRFRWCRMAVYHPEWVHRRQQRVFVK